MKNWKGIGVSDGIASGHVLRVRKVKTIQQTTLAQVRAACIAKTGELYESTKAKFGEEHAQIFLAYQILLEDPELYDGVNSRLQKGQSLQNAIEYGFEELADMFEALSNEYMRQRAEDIRGLKKMHLQMLLGEEEVFEEEWDRKVILVAEELTALDLAAVDTENLAGILINRGGRFSHAMIMARSMNIPAVTGIKELDQLHNGDEVFLDGATGDVLVVSRKERGRTLPEEEKILALWREKFRQHLAEAEKAGELPKDHNLTLDGTEIEVRANIRGPEELRAIDRSRIAGVGLYRTEYLFLDRETEPSVLEQQLEYEQVFDLLEGKDLTVRTLDTGGDKRIPYLQEAEEDNPALGIRGIRFTLKYPELLESQMEALLRAANGRPFSLMFPMVDTVEEVQQARAIWAKVLDKLKKENHPVSDEIRIGIMVETPAAALCIDLFMDHVDFVSIGTNDLTQHIMAADRENVEMDHLLSPWQPAVSRVIRHIVEVCQAHGKKVSVCGESGADPEFLKQLVKMGVRSISVSRSRIDLVRIAISRMTVE